MISFSRCLSILQDVKSNRWVHPRSSGKASSAVVQNAFTAKLQEFYLNSNHCSSVRQTCLLLPPSLLSCWAHARIVMALLYTGLLGWDVGICGLTSCYWDHLCARKKINSQLFVAQYKGFSLAPMVEGIVTSVSAHPFKWRRKRRMKDNCTVWAFYLEVLYFKRRKLKKCIKKLGL